MGTMTVPMYPACPVTRRFTDAPTLIVPLVTIAGEMWSYHRARAGRRGAGCDHPTVDQARIIEEIAAASDVVLTGIAD
jgi:hypothetical protein